MSANPTSAVSSLAERARPSPIEDIIKEAQQGRMYILVDHASRENEGDLILPADFVTPAAINFMATYGRGLICLALPPERVDELGLPMMTRHNETRHKTAFTVSIEAREGITTGISAADRAHSIATAVNPQSTRADIVTPGHVFPLRARQGGVLVRAGHTEAACDINRLAGRSPAAVLCEIMNEDGTMARLPDLYRFAKHHGLKIGTISDLIAYRARNDNLIAETERRQVRSEFGGDWEMRIFTDKTYGIEHVALIKGDITTDGPVLVRAHALHEATDVLGLGPKPADELRQAMRLIAAEGRGVVCLLRAPRHALHASETPEPRIVKHTGLGAQIFNKTPSTRYLGLDAYGLSIAGTRPIHLDRPDRE
ncbi:MAG: 3,4-dihydroxy-2-butanone-4-phosphate synthase [Rhodobacteraceae bacterium]|nr:3,4-dihydroxy-2-butanone-4-phosphate synthase [Paracoccaceae bacterium]